MRQCMIQAQGIVCGYGRKKVITDAELTVMQGECVGIVGANGCGKSTLFSVLAGIKKPAAGTLLLAGQDALRDKKLFFRIAGYVPQESPLIPELTVKDNLRLWYTAKGGLEELLNGGLGRMLNLRQMLGVRAEQLSGGMKKRVSIACAMAQNPSVMILDEPSAALDLTCKEEMKEYLQSYRNAGGTILIATHEESELSLCDRLYVIHDGKLAEIDKSLRGRQLIALF